VDRPVLLVLARTVLALLSQGITTLIFWLQGHPSPAIAALPWWTVHGTLIDIGCLVLLVYWTHREGIHMFDLVSLNRKKMVTDILLGLGIFVLVFPVTIAGGSSLASLIVYGSIQPHLPEGAFLRLLPPGPCSTAVSSGGSSGHLPKN
jgi:hypothetical protein